VFLRPRSARVVLGGSSSVAALPFSRSPRPAVGVAFCLVGSVFTVADRVCACVAFFLGGISRRTSRRISSSRRSAKSRRMRGSDPARGARLLVTQVAPTRPGIIVCCLTGVERVTARSELIQERVRRDGARSTCRIDRFLHSISALVRVEAVGHGEAMARVYLAERSSRSRGVVRQDDFQPKRSALRLKLGRRHI